MFVAPVNVEDDDWAARSQAQLRAVTVGKITVAPPWEDTHQKRGQTPFLVLIRPSMGFGTGHHATTRLMLKALQALAVEDRTVLDIGCGSGVLAIAAAKLAARSAVGIDIDPDALLNAAENLQLNELDGRVRFELGDFRNVSSPAQIVMANLTGGLLTTSAGRLVELVDPAGYLIVSGFMESERPSVLSALEELLPLEHIDQEDEWMCAVFQKSRQM